MYALAIDAPTDLESVNKNRMLEHVTGKDSLQRPDHENQQCKGFRAGFHLQPQNGGNRYH